MGVGSDHSRKRGIFEKALKQEKLSRFEEAPRKRVSLKRGKWKKKKHIVGSEFGAGSNRQTESAKACQDEELTFSKCDREDESREGLDAAYF